MSESPIRVEEDYEVTSDIPGPIFMGTILNWVLFCCFVMQVYTYHISSKNDRIALKLLVHFLFLAAIVQIGFATNYTWRILVTSWSKPPGLSHREFLHGICHQAVVVLPIINAFIAAIVQIFFAWRIWVLNRSAVGRIFAVLIGIVAIIQSAGSVIMMLLTDRSSVSADAPVFWLSGNLIVDVLIASSMLYTLYKARHQSVFKGARTIISRLMVNAVETGAITVVTAAAELALILTIGSNWGYYLTVPFVLGPLFLNVCLANLNARTRTRRLGDHAQFSTSHNRDTAGGSPGSGGPSTTLRFAIESTNATRSGTNLGETEIGASDPVQQDVVSSPNKISLTSQV
ncbi:hypothetical protein BD779DRAFT_1603377 [Infundibulicybe gibba]|nr:hypothetical protein BD779DRAFT_1603377 [Infundibulicybe gibba]